MRPRRPDPVDFSEFFDGFEGIEMSEQTCSIGFVRWLPVAASLTPRSAQLTSADLCLDFLYRNPLLGGATRDGGLPSVAGLPRQGLLHFCHATWKFRCETDILVERR